MRVRMKQFKAASLMTAIKTPFNVKGEIDFNTYDQLVAKQIKAGVDGIVVGGTTGEGHLLTWEEHLILIAHSVHKHGKDLLIIGNTGSNNTREAIKATQYGFAAGMDATLQINPYYGRSSSEGVIAHFEKLLDIGPTFIYNVPSRTGQDLTPELIEPLSTHKNFIGVKECTGNERIAYYEERGIACWSGNDDESAAGRHQYGSHGVISVTSNIVPNLMRQLIDAPNDSLQQSMEPLMQWLFCEPNPIGINTALMMTGAVAPIFRMPYKALTKVQREQGLALLANIAKDELVGDKLMLMADDDFQYCC
ncbi:4-hydroxy-tetrahydrodipicolinate synthase [Colwellia sp. MB02u-18]|nr:MULTISPECIES: 4-hydroxy-tetrahydrodipicolinate synthase [unclassified Colwellia]MBA6223976.1 4-hydroxy-tetrahydrodipicolinate synthase [Colwellia sp. MB3u-45]MBA6266117.1 4-hydroxy-tetrahydrodipicolinate synthase [Colwellia sp. MB3u-43]MBA6289445.1 4-hydroxy-tetrahydrodipicolinate synthase [Colwellia sp. MB3u-4]MBA6320157.1 4-hydroxy-tetrahydrodipicolinate synthase [Colwellia sp. MB02u-19]MBA6325968.1 4-hydroxy-tetrahydrodipicolinate synthase [Colwellia sp. MB02u-18]